MNHKQIRRGRKTNPQKDTLYQCPCGRIYTSYPALYTHIKQNHNGEAPGLIKMPENAGRRIGASKIEEHNKKKRIEGSRQQPKKLTDILKPLMIQIQPSLPDFVVDMIQKHYLYRFIEHQPKPFNPPFSDIDSIYDIKICQGLSNLFLQISQILSKEAYNVVRILILMLLDYMVHDAQDEHLIIQGSLSQIIDYANYFIVTNFLEKINKYKLEGCWLAQKQNIMIIFDAIFKWMVFKGYTLTIVNINPKYNQSKDEAFSSTKLSLSLPNQNSDSDYDDLQDKKLNKNKTTKGQTQKKDVKNGQSQDEESNFQENGK